MRKLALFFRIMFYTPTPLHQLLNWCISKGKATKKTILPYRWTSQWGRERSKEMRLASNFCLAWFSKETKLTFSHGVNMHSYLCICACLSSFLTSFGPMSVKLQRVRGRKPLYSYEFYEKTRYRHLLALLWLCSLLASAESLGSLCLTVRSCFYIHDKQLARWARSCQQLYRSTVCMQYGYWLCLSVLRENSCIHCN